MTDELNADVLGAEWDLGEVLAERAQPKAQVEIYLNELASYTKSELIKQHERTTDPKTLTDIEAAIAKVDAEIEATKYVVHLTAIPSRMREDIASKAMSQFPMKLDFIGRDDPENAIARLRRESELIWAAQITQVDNPHGQSKKNWTEEEISKFSQAIPNPAYTAITKAIDEITKQAEEYTVKSKSLDF